MAKKTALERAVEIVGSQSALARYLGVDRSRVHHWLHRDKTIPAEFASAIEKATQRKVTRQELCPHVDWA